MSKYTSSKTAKNTAMLRH